MFFRRAVLVIHGFAGGVYDEEELINYLQLDGSLDVFSFTLPGHERNLSKVKYQEWINASKNKLEWLINNGYKNIYLIGHSMGGVIASYLSTQYSEVKKVVLAAPAFEYLQVKEKNLNLIKNIKETPEILRTYSFEEIFSRLLKLNISAVKEFRDLVSKYHDFPQKINIPIMILQGTDDKIVPMSSSVYVFEKSKSKTKRLIIINGVTHDIFRSKRVNEINLIVKKFLKKKYYGIRIVEI